MAKRNTAARDGNGTETAPNGPTPRENTAPGTGAGTRADGPAPAVQGALAAHPGGTVAAIALAAGVSKNAARKALLALEAEGLAARTTGGRDGGKRAPDTWHPATTPAEPGTDPRGADTPDGAVSVAEDKEAATPPAGGPAADEDTAPTDATPHENAGATITPEPGPEPVPEETAAEATETEAEAEAEGGMDAAAVTEASEALTALQEAVGAALTALEAGDRAAVLEVAETIYTGSGKARRLMRTAAGGRARNASGRSRSHPGELRSKVAAHLAAHPGAEFTPHEIGKVIGHSAGAIANALDRLVTLGEAVTTCERPRRFTATPDTPTPDAPAPDAPAPDAGVGAEEPTEPATT